MIVLQCPVCDTDVDVGGSFRKGKYTECDSCGSILTLQRKKPGTWTLIEFEEEWEEEEEDKKD